MGLVLRVILALLAGYWLSRRFRPSRPPGRPPRDPRSRRGLDPERAVRASWSEVEDESKGGTGER